MIKWIRATLYHGHGDERRTGHMFLFDNKKLILNNLKQGEYPPFDCLNLERDDAILLRDFINECLSDNILQTECRHEPDMNFAHDERPRYIKSHNPKCIKCGEFYSC